MATRKEEPQRDDKKQRREPVGKPGRETEMPGQRGRVSRDDDDRNIDRRGEGATPGAEKHRDQQRKDR